MRIRDATLAALRVLAVWQVVAGIDFIGRTWENHVRYSGAELESVLALFWIAGVPFAVAIVLWVAAPALSQRIVTPCDDGDARASLSAQELMQCAFAVLGVYLFVVYSPRLVFILVDLVGGGELRPEGLVPVGLLCLLSVSLVLGSARLAMTIQRIQKAGFVKESSK